MVNYCIKNVQLSIFALSSIFYKKPKGFFLKKFENDPSTKNVHILRSKADCLRVCKNGPILLIWPDGIWYEKVSPEKISEIFTSHVIKGKPIEKWIFKKTPFLNSPDTYKPVLYDFV